MLTTIIVKHPLIRSTVQSIVTSVPVTHTSGTRRSIAVMPPDVLILVVERVHSRLRVDRQARLIAVSVIVAGIQLLPMYIATHLCVDFANQTNQNNCRCQSEGQPLHCRLLCNHPTVRSTRTDQSILGWTTVQVNTAILYLRVYYHI